MKCNNKTNESIRFVEIMLQLSTQLSVIYLRYIIWNLFIIDERSKRIIEKISRTMIPFLINYHFISYFLMKHESCILETVIN